ncbi:MAG: PAS domain S-box protein, partial [Deltaproteobacteria bacterium]
RYQARKGDAVSASAARKDGYGYSSASFVMPFFIREECRGCHIGGGNDVVGAVSVTVSLRRYSGAVSAHWKSSMFWGGFIFVLTSGAVLLTVHRRFVSPLEILKKGVDSLAAGDLSHRVGIHTGDEIEDLGSAFDRMAASLHAATADLEELNEKHSMIVQMAADAIVLKDCGTMRFVDANPAAVNLTGYSREELLKMRFEDMFPPDKLPEYREIFKRWYHDGKGYLYGAVIIKKDGFTVPVEIAASVMELNGKKYIQEIWRDLSERKGFEEAIRRHIEELEGTVRERTAKLNKSLADLEAAYKRLQESEQMFVESAKLISLGEMGASIAHELNSPLAGILSITEVLLGRLGAGDPSRFMLEKIKDAAVRSKYIIVDMMTYARPSKGAYEPMFLNESIRATLTLFISELKTSSIEIHEDFDPDLPKITGNKGQIMEVILNIIKNARDVMRGTGGIFISTRAVAVDGRDFAVAEIRDTGPGIPGEIMDKIFDPFFTTKEKGGGLNIGLGLSIS